MPIPLSKFIKEIYRSLYIGALLRGEEEKKQQTSALKDERNLALLPGEENNKY